MVNIDKFKRIALSFPEVTEQPHFEKSSFRVNKKIFATLNEQANRATLKLSLSDQDIFALGSESIYPVPNKWGKQGWTTVEFNSLPEEMLRVLLSCAYIEVAPEKLGSKVIVK